mmetsp:Transcript_22647/g.52582  ORF Transcript_22647/g.52582 Transcript_22647/m.52582 type:complete len:206 (+) Transcript_22647:62-679(+)
MQQARPLLWAAVRSGLSSLSAASHRRAASSAVSGIFGAGGARPPAASVASSRSPLSLSTPPAYHRWQTSAAAAAQDGVGDSQPPAAPVKKRAPRKKRDVLKMTDNAVRRIRELVESKDPHPLGIRLGVRTRGCNGLSYTMNYVDEAPKLDDVVESDGVRVFIDPKAVMFLVGSTMDFVEDTIKAEFVFENPNAKGACGCGESFNV